MVQERRLISALVALRAALLVAIPLAAAGVLRLFPPLMLAEDGEIATWLIPGISATLAVVGAAATVLAVMRAFQRDGTLGDLLTGGGLGALTAASMAVALSGPAGGTVFPTPVIALGTMGAGVACLGASLLPAIGLGGRGNRLATTAFIFGWIELAPAIGLLGAPLAALTSIIAGGGAAMIAIAAAATSVRGDQPRAAWLALMASGSAALAVSRIGSADALPALAGLAAAVAGSAMDLVQADGTEEPVAAVPLLTSHPSAPTPSPHADEGLRLARELRGTIAELLAARKTIELQRDELARVALLDVPTGVESRIAILDRLRREAAGARRYNHPVALVIVDLDGMAALNRGSGTEIGDLLLRELALRLRLRVRAADAVGRLGADRFLAILPHTDERGATVFADAVRTKLTAAPIETVAGPISVTVSIGITIIQPGLDLADEELLGRAEEALASARAAGGNRIAFDRSHGLARLEDLRPGPHRKRATDTRRS
jgi:diguanylate cyclase (GGDEF)-like protein